MTRSSLHLFVIGALAVAALAGTQQDPELADPCGDSHTGVHLGDEDVTTPPTRDGDADLRALWFEQDLTEEGAVEAVHVHLEVCDDVPPEPEDWSSFSAWWELDDGCTLRVGLDSILYVVDGPVAEFRRDATYRKRCPADGLTPFDTTSETIFEVAIDGAVAIDGPRVTWTLSPDELPGDAAATMRPGTVWHRPSAQVGQYSGPSARASGVYVEVAPLADRGIGGRDVVMGGGASTSSGN